MSGEYLIVDLRREFRGNPYITLWRPDNAGYAYPLAWAGRYTLEQIEADPSYYAKRRYRNERVFDRWPVRVDALDSLWTAPAPGRIDGDAGPVLRNDERTRRALRRARLIPSTLPNTQEGRG